MLRGPWGVRVRVRSSSSPRARWSSRVIAGGDVGEAVEPLDDDGGAIEGLDEAQLLELLRALDAIEVGVDEGDPPRVLVDEREGGAGDVAVGGDADAARDALHEGRLPGAERADERDHVAHGQRAPEALAERLRLGGGGGGEDEAVTHSGDPSPLPSPRRTGARANSWLHDHATHRTGVRAGR